MISTGDMKRGATIELDGRVYQVMEFAHIKTGRGSAQMRMKLRDVRRGDTIEKTFQAGEKWPRVRVERVPMQLSYVDGDMYYFMNTENYEQTHLTKDTLGDAVDYLTPNLNIKIEFFDGKAVGVELPQTVELTVVETEPGLRSATASSVTKPAKTETGLVVQVPPFINEGERIKVDTSEGAYLSRA